MNCRTNRLAQLFEPWQMLDAMQREFQKSFDQSLPMFVSGSATSRWRPTADGAVCACDLPGVEAGDLTIEIEGQRLFVTARRNTPACPAGSQLLVDEVTSGAIERSWNLPFEIDATNSTAELRDGVLTLAVKKSPAEQRHRIAVSAD